MIKGPVFSIITPFKNNGKYIDYESLENYINFLYEGGARIFYAMAFNTRYLLMSEDEILKVNEIVIKKVKSYSDTYVIVGDPLDCSTDTSIRFAQHAKENGADMISLIYRAYLFFDDHVYEHYKKVAETVDIDILVHEMPFNKGIPAIQDGSWSLDLLNRLADIPNVKAIKEDTKNDEYTRKIVDLLSDRVDVIVSGNGLQQWLKVSDKCQAWLSGIGNFAPKLEVDFFKTQDMEIIEKVEKPFFWCKDNLSWHLSIKSALEHLGIMSREERMPYIALNNVQHKKVTDIIDEIRNSKKLC